MLGMAFVAGQKQHISLTLFLDKVSPMILGWWDIVLQVIFIAFSIWVLIIGGLKISAISMLQISPALGIPMGETLLRASLRGRTNHLLWATEYR